MIEEIFTGVAQAALLVLLVYFYILLVSVALPRKCLRPIFPAVKHDRGVKKYVFPEGRSIAYEPKLSIRKYISGYVLYSENGKKYIKCKISKNIKDIKFSIVIFDRHDKCTGALNIEETIEKEGYTQAVRIPDETSYVQMNILSVNKKAVESGIPDCYSAKNIVLYVLATLFGAMIIGVIFSVATYDLLGIFISDYSHYSDFNPATGLMFGIFFGIMTVGINLMLNLSSNVKIVTPKEENGKK